MSESERSLSGIHLPEPDDTGMSALASTFPPLVILNPMANGGRARPLRALLERALADGRGELTLTTKPGHGALLATQAVRDGRGVVVVGGDGSIHEVAGAMVAAGTQLPLGIVPAGTGNDYAYRALRLPHDPLQALERALTGRPVALDVGIMNGRCFVNALGVGLDANIAATAERFKRAPFLRGQALYWTASLNELLLHYNRCPELSVILDDEPLERRRYALADVSIGPTYGGGFAINPGADPTDGLFDLCAIWKPSLPRALRLLPKVERGQHLHEAEVSCRRVRHVVLEAQRPIYAHLDGEVISGQRFDARIRPGALLVRGANPPSQADGPA